MLKNNLFQRWTLANALAEIWQSVVVMAGSLFVAGAALPAERLHRLDHARQTTRNTAEAFGTNAGRAWSG